MGERWESPPVLRVFPGGGGGSGHGLVVEDETVGRNEDSLEVEK